MRTASPGELLGRVVDCKSFTEFVSALAEEREEAERMERAEPEKWKWGGPMGWQHADISQYLAAALPYFTKREKDSAVAQPSWRDLAEFLYHGKIYE